jgi:hypothetical protein
MKLYTIYALICCSWMMTGCQSSPQPTVDTRTPGYKPVSLLSSCDKLTPNYTVTRKNAYPYYKCVVDTKKKYNQYSEALEIETDNRRLLLAKEYSSGKWSDSEYAELNQQIGNSYTETRIGSLQREHQQEVRAQEAINAQRAQAASNALLYAGSQMQQNYYNQQLLNQNQQAINRMNRPVTTNCNSLGNSVNCTSY